MSSSRRFSTFDPPSRIPSSRTPVQKGRTSGDDPVQHKLIQVRIRARSHSMSAPSIEDEKEQKKKTLQRLAALTTSAKAKQVHKPEDQRRQKKPDSDAGKPVRPLASNASAQTRQLPHTNPKKPVQRRDTANSNKITSSVSSRVPRERASDRKASRGASAKKRSTVVGSSTDSRKPSSSPPLINFFESDSDEDEIFERNRSSVRAQRRQSMPAVRDATKNTYSDEQTGEGQHEAGFLKELLEIKSRLSMLEVSKPAPVIEIPSKVQSDNISPRSSVNSPTVSVFDRSSAHSHGGSPAEYSSASSINTSRTRTTCHQRQLQDAFTVLNQRLSVAHKGDPPLLRALEAVMASTIDMNQILWTSIPQDLQTDAPTLVAMQKNSDIQLKKLTESLRLLADTSITRPSCTDDRHLSHSNTFSPPIDAYGSRAMNMTIKQQRYDTDADRFVYPHSPMYTRSPLIDPPSPHIRSSDQVPPLKVAGILEPSQQRYNHRHRRYYEPGYPDADTISYARLSYADNLHEAPGSVHEKAASVRRQSSLLSRPAPDYHRDSPASVYHVPTNEFNRNSVYSDDVSTSSSSRLKKQTASHIDQPVTRYPLQTR